MAATSSDSPRWTTAYPPLAAIAVVLFLLLVVLPSSLNLPQANPSTTPEFAPVPPDDNNPPPAVQGNLSSLGLASTGGFNGNTGAGNGAAGSFEPPPPPAAAAAGKGKNPSTKRCIGKPPRQSEDPLAPPCVAFFNGNNGGSTYQGTTGDEIRILFYLDGGLQYSSSRTETMPLDKLYDLDAAPADDDPVFVRNLRVFDRYFNDRYQTYERRAHFWIYFSKGSAATAQSRRADAASLYDTVKPFAALAYPYYGFQDEFIAAMAGRGVSNFGGQYQRKAAFFREFATLLWGFRPSIEQQAAHFTSYVCTQVVGKPVAVAGNDSDVDARLHNGEPRRLGFLYAADPARREFTYFADLVRSGVKACGGEFVQEHSYPRAGYFTPNRDGGSFAQSNMADFKQKGVTTIIWPQGYENEQSKAAGALAYRPEWILGGDLMQESSTNAAAQDPTVWSRHAFVVTPLTKFGELQESPCYQAMKEVQPDAADDDISFSCEFIPFYDDLRQLFTGIQVAGPKLTPTAIDRGFHAIPKQQSSTPIVPACYYDQDDYTCVKDAAVMWWDTAGRSVRGSNGCWRMIEDGKRYLLGTFPDENVGARMTDNDVCNAFSPIAQF